MTRPTDYQPGAQYAAEKIDDFDPAETRNFPNRVGWPVDWARSALLLHDPQDFYLEVLGPLARQRIETNIKSLAERAQERGAPIFVSRLQAAEVQDDRGLLNDIWGAGPEQQVDRISPALGLADHDYHVLLKRTYSTFLNTDPETSLRRRNRDTLVIAGVFTSIGPAHNAIEAFCRDIRPILVCDALADFNENAHLTSLADAARKCDRVVRTVDCL